MHRLNLFFCILCFVSQYTVAQNTIEFAGKVIDAQNENGLQYATVTIQPGNIGLITDAAGKFSILLQPGVYAIQVRHLGYKLFSDSIQVLQKQDLMIPLIREPYFLSGIEVTGESQSQQIVQSDRIDQDAILLKGSGEIGELLRSIPNVGGVRRGGAVLDPVVRGFKYSQLSIYIDGLFYIEGGCPNRMDPTVSRVDAHDIERIELVKGPYALKYGPNFGGTIRLVSHQPAFFESAQPGVRLKAFTELTPYLGQREHVRAEFGNNKAVISVFGGKTDLGNFIDGNGDVLKMQVLKYNFGTKAMVKISDNHLIKFTFNNLQGRNVLFSALPMDERTDNTWFSYVDYFGVLPFSSMPTVSASLYYADVEHIMDNYNRPISDTVAAVSAVDAVTSGAKMQVNWKIGEQFRLVSGADMQKINKDGTRIRTMIMQSPNSSGMIPFATDYLWNNATITNSGVFTEIHKMNGSHRLFASARVDLNNATSDEIVIKHPMLGEIYTYGTDSISSQFINFSFGAGYRYDITEFLSAGITLGRGTRSPDMLERYIILLPVGYDNFDYLGNPQLKPESNHEADLNIRYESPKFGSADVTAFYSYVTDFITGAIIPPAQQKPLSNGVLGVKQYYNATYATFSGFEVALSSPENKNVVLKCSGAYTMGTIGEVVQPLLDLTKPISQQVIGDTLISNDPLAEIPPFEANLDVMLYFFGRKLKTNINTRYIAEQNRVSAATYEGTSSSVILLNFSAMVLMNKNVTISGGVYNIFDEYYYEHLNRKVVGSSAKIYEPGRRFFINITFNL